MAKVFAGETPFNAVFRAMHALSVTALDKTPRGPRAKSPRSGQPA